MPNYFEKRTYSRQEIAQCLALNPKDKNFARKVKTKLANLGFQEDQYIYTRKDVTILWVPTSYDEKITYLIRLLGVDKQVDPQAFSTFIYYMVLNNDYDCSMMPWAERALWLKDFFNLDVSERTLRKWTNKLIDLGILSKDPSVYTWWCSIRINGELYRFPVESDDEKEKMKAYWDTYRKAKKEASETITDKASQGKYIFEVLWTTYHCKYYKCCSFVFCAWEDNDIMKEIRDLILEHFI